MSEASMQVVKRDGRLEPVDVNKIVKAVTRCCTGLTAVDPYRVATKTIGGLYDKATTRELDKLSIQTAAALTAEEPEYSRLAARLLSSYIDKEVQGNGIHSFTQSVEAGHEAGLVNDVLLHFVLSNSRKLNDAVNIQNQAPFEFFGLQTVYDRYLLKEPKIRTVLETPAYFFMRVAAACSESVYEAVALYDKLIKLEYLPGTPTLFNAGLRHQQLSSCFLLDSPQDDLAAIYDKYKDVAQLSKFSGGIGIAYHRVRSRGSLIKSTNGHSNGIVPWLKTLDASVAAVNQGGKRKGAACVYLETWHADIEEFLELRNNTGDEALRTHNLNLANWVPDLFMERVEQNGDWTLFDPKDVPHLPDTWGDSFREAYTKAEERGLGVKKVKAQDLFLKMLKTLAETGQGWLTFKDACNRKSNQTALSHNVIHLSNLCVEICEVSSKDETAVCNLGSINLGKHTKVLDGETFVDYEKLKETTRKAVRQLDRVIDLNLYPIPSTAASNKKWRPIGLGVMGLQDVLFQMGLPFDSVKAIEISREIQATIYIAAVTESTQLAEERGLPDGYCMTRAAQGKLSPDLWNIETNPELDELRELVERKGMRNSLLIAIAPTATIASIAGCYECIEPQVSNLFKRETLSGDFLQVNRYLVEALKIVGRWTPETRDALKVANGSIQGVKGLPPKLYDLFKTAWEVPMKALIDMAVARGPYVDQSQSLNLFMQAPRIEKLASMYMYAWKQGLKTTYYLRSRPATEIAKTTVESSKDPVACSLEDPENCESCQ